MGDAEQAAPAIANLDINNNNNTNTNTTTTTTEGNTTNNTTKPNETQIQYGTWSQVTPAGLGPASGNWHKMGIYKDNFYVFGGNNQQTQFGQLHMYSPASNTWYPLKEGPARTLHSSVMYKDSMIVFGGTGTQEVKSLFRGVSYTPVLFNDVWTYQFATQQWTKVPTTNQVPSPRDGHSAVVHKDIMYVFGGSDNTTVFGDLYALHLDRGVWMRARSEGTLPCPRRMHSCVVWDDCLWVFGGYDGKTRFNDVFVYDIASGTWSIPRMSGVVPHKRFGHSAVVYKDFMYIFGGYGAGSGYRNDLLHFHFPTSTWTLLSEKTALSARIGHTAAVANDGMYIFGGGLTAGNYSNEMWKYEFSEDKVEAVKPTLTEDLQKMLDNPSFYPDVVFKVGERTIRAHKCLLSARCSYFDSLFKSGFQEASSSEIVIEDIGEEVFMVFLKYLYGGPDYLITPEVSFELLTIAERYMLPHLKWTCESVILEGISEENVVTLMITSDTYKCTRLRKSCLDFISKHHQNVVKTEEFKTLPHNLLLEIMTVISATK